MHVEINVKLIKENGTSQLTENGISLKQSHSINIRIIDISTIN